MSNSVALGQRILQELDAEQAAAVASFGPHTLVVAGAGSGKTRVLTYGVAHLLEDHGLQASQLVLLTFTRKAAETMRARAAEVTGRDLSGLRCGTFHAVGAVMLRDAGRDFAIIDELEATTMVTQLGAELFQEREVEGYLGMDPERLCGWFSQVREEDSDLAELLLDAPEYYRDRRSLIHALHGRFCERKAAERLYDYSDVLWETRELLRSEGESIRANTRAVLVDEVQDLNQMQREIVELLTAGGAWTIQVGDAEQAIYSWRGGSYEALLELADEPGLAISKLETNYRSTAEIVDLATAVTPDSKLALRVRSYRGAAGNRPELLRPETPEAEGQAVVSWAQRHYAAGSMLEDMCVLARAHDHLKEAEQALTSVGLPVALLGRRRGLFEDCRQYLLSLMRLASNPHDSSAWQRILPSLGVGAEEQYACLVTLREARNPLRKCADWTSDEKVKAMLLMLDGSELSAWLWQGLCTGPFADIVVRSLPDPAYAPALLSDLIAAGRRDGSGDAYLMALVLGNDDDSAGAGGVRMGTIHASKGLEWRHVLVVRCSHEAFPSRMAVHDGNLDEERRLFYVAVTRAEDTLTVCEAPWLSNGERASVDFLADTNVRALLSPSSS